MDTSPRPIRTGSDADLAFAVMVLASYFTTFSTLQSTSTFDLLLMIGFGVAYIAIGIYGYALVVHADRVQYKVLYFVVQIALGGLIIHLGKGTGFNAMVLLPLAGHSVMLLSGNGRLATNFLIMFVYIGALNPSMANWSEVWSGLPLFLGGQIFIIVFTQMAVNEEHARSEIEKLATDLAAANQTLREYALQVEELATTKERNRLAREIHDGLGHYLTTIFMQIQAARAVMKVNEAKAQDALSTAQNLTQEALVDIRRSVAALRAAPGGGLPLSEEVEKLLKGCESIGITTQMQVIGVSRVLSPASQWTVYRAVQEGLNNVCKHARASRLCVTLDYSQGERVRLVIQDDGVGASGLEGGFGLLGIRERVHLLDGDFVIATAPGQGFKLELQIPI